MADLEKRVFDSEWNLPQDSHPGMMAYAMLQEQATFLNNRNLRNRGKALGGERLPRRVRARGLFVDVSRIARFAAMIKTRRPLAG